MRNQLAAMPQNAAFDETGSSGPPTAVEERRVPRLLSRREKAAVIVRLLLNEGADIPLEDLPDALQAKLTHQMGRMGLVDRVTLTAVANEFAEALEGIGLSFPHGLVGALTAMDGKIATSTAARLRREAGVQQIGDPWVRLQALPADELARIAIAESTEIAAVLLSKLDTAKAAELLGHLPGATARKITFAISQTANVTPEAVDRIGWSLVAQLDARPVRAFEDAPEKRVGDILNQSPSEQREDILSALDETDDTFAKGVRKVLFTFPDIPLRLLPRDVPLVTRAVEPEVLITALAAASEDNAPAAEFLLSNMSARLADNLREEIAERGPIKPADGEVAMTALVTAIRAAEANGELELAQADEVEDTPQDL
ncbi:MAG: FliG C-terminal domain-containing protein [Pseudomonadota bacterium]